MKYANHVANLSEKPKYPCGREAFTLVELLVVIGIIALLVSVLLPALNKARQQANLIDCQSRLRQMGQAIGIYVSENAGRLPLGNVKYDPTDAYGSPIPTSWLAGTTPQSAEISWFWTFTLSQMIQANLLGPDRLVHNLSPIFKDVDTIDAAYGRYINHYTCNPKIFPSNDEDDEYTASGVGLNPQYYEGRKFSNIKPSTVFLIWDAPQVADWNSAGGTPNNAYESATCIDENTLTYGSFLFTGINNPQFGYNRPAYPGAESYLLNNSPLVPQLARNAQKQYNVDIPAPQPGVGGGQDYFNSHMRFRHLNNTTLNALCVDGHVESRAVGTFMVDDICINPPG